MMVGQVNRIWVLCRLEPTELVTNNIQDIRLRPRVLTSLRAAGRDHRPQSDWDHANAQ